eukprot:6204144-Pleurochrysis_carterae.AAC.1
MARPDGWHELWWAPCVLRLWTFSRQSRSSSQRYKQLDGVWQCKCPAKGKVRRQAQRRAGVKTLRRSSRSGPGARKVTHENQLRTELHSTGEDEVQNK